MGSTLFSTKTRGKSVGNLFEYKIIKAEPKTSAQLDPELSNEARIYFYEGGIIVGADSDDKIVLIQY